jgi:integrase
MGTVDIITSRTIQALSREAVERGKPVYAWDSALRGFGIKASPQGTLSYLVQKWVGGRGGVSKRIVIGHHPAWDLKQARKEAGSIIGDVAKGIDIVDRKAQLRIAQREALKATRLGDAVDLYLKRHRKDGQYWGEVEATLQRELVTTFGRGATVVSVSKAEVRKLIDAKQDAGMHGAARALFAFLRPFFKWCVERDMIAASPLDTLKAPMPLQARDRILSDDEVKLLWEATETLSATDRNHRSMPSPVFGSFYKLLLLTAQRREEVAAMEWSEVDGGVWTIPGTRTKNGKEHTVHLSPQALAILASIPKQEGCRYVLSTNGKTSISGYGKAKARLDTLMKGVDPWRVHDLRRTAASGMARLGFQPHIIERVLNHVSGAQGGLVGVYQRYEYLEERKRALEAWSAHVNSIVQRAIQPSNVVSFSR